MFSTGKSLSEAFILTSTNPQYDKRLFIDLSVQYMKTASSEHVVYINCSECQSKNKKQFVYKTCSELAVFMYWTAKWMNNIFSYCGLVDPKISASDKDIPVQKWFYHNYSSNPYAFSYKNIFCTFILSCVFTAFSLVLLPVLLFADS